MNWGIVVVAGGRVGEPLAGAISSDRKCLAVVHGRTCLDRVLSVCADSSLGPVVCVTGPDAWEDQFEAQFVAEKGRQMENVKAGVDALPLADAFLFLPADAPFLRPEGLTNFVHAVEARATSQKWLAAGMCHAEEFRRAFPECPKPSLRLKGGKWHSGAYFAASRDGFVSTARVIEGFSEDRRSQVKMALRLGLGNMLKFATGQFGLSDGERVLEKIFGCHAILIDSADPESIIDIDDPAEYAQVQAAAERYWRS